MERKGLFIHVAKGFDKRRKANLETFERRQNTLEMISEAQMIDLNKHEKSHYKRRQA